MEQNTNTQKLSDIISVIKSSVQLWTKNNRWLFILKAQTVIFFVIFIQVLPIAMVTAFAAVATKNGNESVSVVGTMLISLLCLVFSVLFFGFVMAMSTGIYIEAYHNTQISMLEFAKKAYKKNYKFLGITFILYLMLMFGFMFFIIPAIILGIMFSYTLYIAYEENVGVIEAFQKGASLVNGYKLELFKKGAVVFAISMAISIFFGAFENEKAPLIMRLIATLIQLPVEVVIGSAFPFIWVTYYFELKKIKGIQPQAVDQAPVINPVAPLAAPTPVPAPVTTTQEPVTPIQ